MTPLPQPSRSRLLAAGLLASLAPRAAAPREIVGPEPLVQVEPSRIRVEAGAIVPLGKTRFALRHPGVRVVVPGAPGSAARISFVHRGPARGAVPLASGELRRQIGLKLRARDTCNVLYVMWHIAPTAGIHVQLKSNPGQSTHRECHDHGYRTLEPSFRREAPELRVGERHSLEAQVEGKELRVVADGVPIWRGALPDEALELDGPAGIRSDNGEFEVELWTAARGGPDLAR